MKVEKVKEEMEVEVVVVLVVEVGKEEVLGILVVSC